MAGISTSTAGNLHQGDESGKNYTIPLLALTVLFFMWGFITCMNDIMIPFFKIAFKLENFEAGLVQFFFFFAYFSISLVYFIISSRFGDPISKIGYKNGIIAGLITAGIGSCLFFPAAEMKSYPAFLFAFFVLAAGVVLLQMAANPYVALLGSPKTSSSRLNMTQAFNSLGTTVAPIIGSKVIFGNMDLAAEVHSLDVVKMPYLVLAGTLFALAVFISAFKLPRFTGEKIEKGLGVLRFSHLTLGIVALFMYVGAEVALGSFMANYFGEIRGFNEEVASKFIAFFWGGAMIGRFMGALSLSNSMEKLKRYGLIALITVVATTIVYFFMVDVVEEFGLTFISPGQTALIVLGLIALNIIAFQIGATIPSRTLGIFAIFNAGLLILSTSTSGAVSMWSLIAVGLFNSIMFPTIFTLAIEGLGKYTSQGSSLLMIGIVGGAIVTPIVGKFADLYNYQFAYIIPVICYLYIVYYGFAGYKVKLRADQVVDAPDNAEKPKNTEKLSTADA
ncbi:sugar MFS transporter [Cytophagaceae bacterium ABcell3]|nr:sugar MFS transporter [Cytophagaceae bacterium ABcell3]